MLPEKKKKALLTKVSLTLAESSIQEMRRDKTVSRTLKRSLTSRAKKGGTGKKVIRSVTTGYFWAKAYHDGRKAIEAKPGKWLTFWWRTPKARDPRLIGGEFPKTKSQRRKLRAVMSKGAFKRAIESGELVLTKRVKSWKGNRFMPRAFRRVAKDPFINRRMEDQVENDITHMLDPIMGTSAKKPFREKRIFVKLKRP